MFPRRTAAATVLMLVLPLLSNIDALATWAPTALLATPGVGLADLAAPLLSAVAVSAACVLAAGFVANRQSLRREA